MNLGIIGAAASGKSSIALDILNNTSKAGVRSVFASLDMYRTRMYEKILYKVSGGMKRKDLYNMYKESRNKELDEKVMKEFGNVNIFDKSAATVDDIRDYIIACEEKYGEKVKLVMVDYFERVNTDVSDDTAASKRIANELQDLVNDMNVCLITLVQPNKFSIAGGPDKPILDYTAIKGSSFIYQSFRGILSLWRPFFTPDTVKLDKYMEMAILKNDLGTLNRFQFGWHGPTGEIRELEDHERAELRRLLKEKNDKSDESDWSWES
jgi:replicative DNA helicase